MLITTAVLMLFLHLFMHKTRWGLALSATSIHFDTSSLMGVNTNVVVAIAFGLASMLAGVAGLLVWNFLSADGCDVFLQGAGRGNARYQP